MTDLTPEGLRARAAKIVGDYNSDDSPHDGEIMGRYEHRLVNRIAAPFTPPVAEVRLTVLQEVNQLACDGLSSSLSIKGMLAMHDRRVVAEARRAQREADRQILAHDVALPIIGAAIHELLHIRANGQRAEPFDQCSD